MWFHRRDRELIEFLDRQTEELLRGQAPAVESLRARPGLADEAGALLKLAEALARALQPVRPSPRYRAHLRQGLVEAAQRKRARQMSMSRPPAREPWRPWVVGAAALGSAVSVLGVIAYLVRHRYSERAEQITPR